MPFEDLIAKYECGAKELRQAIAGMSREQLAVAPVEGKWSTQQVVCHLADFEPIYADRMKRVIAENEPALPGGDQGLFAAKLAYDKRDVEEELRIIESVRAQMARILRTLKAEDFQRKGIHSEDGPMTLETLLVRVANHIPHHIPFIYEKRRALGL
jgi:uncharacterized damage-inducible protein DinB